MQFLPLFTYKSYEYNNLQINVASTKKHVECKMMWTNQNPKPVMSHKTHSSYKWLSVIVDIAIQLLCNEDLLLRNWHSMYNASNCIRTMNKHFGSWLPTLPAAWLNWIAVYLKKRRNRFCLGFYGEKFVKEINWTWDKYKIKYLKIKIWILF